MGDLSRGAWLVAAIVLGALPVRSQAPRKVSIDGDVIDVSTGRGIAGARVRLATRDEEPRFTTADEQGHFRFTGLDANGYQAEARVPGFVRANFAAMDTADAPVEFAPRSSNGRVRLEMRRGAAIVGKVTDPLGVPLEGVSVTAFERDTTGERRNAAFTEGGIPYFMVRAATTDDLGAYRIAPLGPGPYYVMARPGSNYFSSQPAMRPPDDPRERATYYPHAPKIGDAKPLELAEGKETIADLRMIREGGVTVSGRILGTTAALQPGSFDVVNLWAASFGVPNVSTNVTGDRYTAWNVIPGKYTLMGEHDANGDVLAAVRRTIDVGTQDMQGIDLTLAPTPNLEATVAFESGCQASRVVIQLISDIRTLRNVHVDPDERIVLQHIVAGKYRVFGQPENDSRNLTVYAKLGDTEAPADGFEVTPETKGPLHITLSCRPRSR